MAESGMAAYGDVMGVAITLAIILFTLRGNGHHEIID